MKRTVTVLGGDMRQVRLAGLLIEDGWDVITWGLEQGDGPNQAPLKQALAAELLILPLPVCRAVDRHGAERGAAVAPPAV